MGLPKDLPELQRRARESGFPGRVFISPEHDRAGFDKFTGDIHLGRENMGESREKLLTVLAHEMGHWEQAQESKHIIMLPADPATQLDAFFRGRKWAELWGVSSEYMSAETAIRRILRPPTVQDWAEGLKMIFGFE